MSLQWQRRLAVVALAGLAWWFFGNLYEAIVFSPNWVVDSTAQFVRLEEFFVRTGPTLYFVPVTQLATVLVWVLFAVARDPAARRALGWASLAGRAAPPVNVVVVTTVVPVIFGADVASRAPLLAEYAGRWNVLNAVRLVLTWLTLAATFAAYRALDRAVVSRPDPETRRSR